MPRVRVIHWKAAEVGPLLAALRDAGVEAEYDDCESTPELSRRIRQNPPDVIVIDISRSPSLGRSVAEWFHRTKALRDIPILFANGAQDKVAKLREVVPDAVCVDNKTLKATLGKVLKSRSFVASPIVLPHVEKTTAQKLGIDKGGSVGVVDAPRGYLKALGELPDDAEVIEEPEAPPVTTLWFIHDPESFLDSLPKMWTIAARTRLWILWRKGSTNGLTQVSIREAAREAGLVDYKICSVSKEWSGMLFARKKA